MPAQYYYLVFTKTEIGTEAFVVPMARSATDALIRVEEELHEPIRTDSTFVDVNKITFLTES